MCWGHLEKSSASGIPHPHAAAFSFQEINSVRSALQEFGRGYTLPRAPGALEVSSPAQLGPRGGRPAGAVRARALGQAGRQPGQSTQTQRVHSFGRRCNSEQMPQGPLAQPALDRGARQWHLWSASCVPWSRNRISVILSLLWLFYFCFWPHQVACGILFPNQGLNQCPPPPGEAQSPNQCTDAKVREHV